MEQLLQKRQEFAKKLESILAERARQIQEKTALYIAQLNAEPLPEEVDKLKAVIEAIDSVIDYEKASIIQEVKEIVAEPIKEEVPATEVLTKEQMVEQVMAEVIPTISAETRPGMEYVGIPTRE